MVAAIVAAVILIPFLCYMLWIVKCADKAYQQRGQLIDEGMRVMQTDFTKATLIYMALRNVSFEKHTSKLVRFQDPLELYEPRIRQFMREYVG